MEAVRQHHISMTSEQTQHQQAASSNRTLLASVNHGRPDIAATTTARRIPPAAARRKLADMAVRIVPFENQKEASHPGRPPENGRAIENRPLENPRETNHPVKPSATNGRTFEDRPPTSRPSNSSRVNPGLEQKQQRELEKMRRQQDSERQKVQQRHVQEQQKLNDRGRMINGSRSSSNAASNSKWSKCSRSTLNSHKDTRAPAARSTKTAE